MPPAFDGHALVVGIDDYQHVRRLPATSDAQDVHGVLVDPALCGYQVDRVNLLYNGAATAAAIRAGLADLAARASAESVVVVYFSGHGGRLTIGGQAADYLLPVEADGASPEALAATSLAGAEVTAALAAIPARQVVVVFDCCHAGGIGEVRDLATAAALAPGLSERLYEAVRDAGRGRVIFAAARGDEPSHVVPGDRNGVFTRHLLDGLRGGAASEDGFVRVFDLFEYLQPKVTGEQPGQHPVFKAAVEQNFAVALFRGGVAGTVSRDGQGFRYDAYISYVDSDPDSTWVWGELMPRLEAAGLRLVVSGESETAGVSRVVSIERGVTEAKRTVVLLSPAYVRDHIAEFENTLAQTLGLEEGQYRLLPMKIAPVPDAELPLRIRMLSMLDVTHPRRGPGEIDRLIAALQGPLPGM